MTHVHGHETHDSRREGPAEHVHDAHAGHHTEDFLKKFWVVLALTVPLILYSELPTALLSWTAPAFSGSDYLQLVLGSMVFFYGGLGFLKGGHHGLWARRPGTVSA